MSLNIRQKRSAGSSKVQNHLESILNLGVARVAGSMDKTLSLFIDMTAHSAAVVKMLKGFGNLIGTEIET